MTGDGGGVFYFYLGLTQIFLPQIISRGNFCFSPGCANSSLAFGI